MTTQKQSGFASLEIVLLAVVVLVLGGTGWFVWHVKRTADRSLANTVTSAQGQATHVSGGGEAPGSSTRQLTLDHADVTVTIPVDWAATSPSGPFKLTAPSAADGLDRAEVAPADAAAAQAGSAFGLQVTVTRYDDTNLTAWYWHTYVGEGGPTAEDVTSASTIHGYDGFSRTQTNHNYTDKWYVLHKDSTAVVVYARMLSTHYAATGVIDERDDYTMYQPQVDQIVQSINIK
ncbi:MAG TPA: hypothetical protein VFH39_00795 [Candidatus Saccharimonadales bacterium]|nr:hypothetical protein [Candidatus Saccharimonadales bacterium]